MILATLLILSILLTSNLKASAATLIVDQQCSSVGSSYLDGIGTHEPAGQIFKPVQTSVVAFAIYVQSLNNFATAMTANIRAGGIGGAVIGSYAFTVPAGFGSSNGAWLLVQFPSGTQVTPGASYALDLTDNSGSSGIRWYACSTSYSDGCGYGSGVCVLPASWTFLEYAGDFGIGLSSSSIAIPQGSTGSLTVTVASYNSFASPVTLSFSGPSGVSGSFAANSVTPPSGGTATSTFTVFVPASVSPGIYSLTITGASGPSSHSATLTVTVVGTSPFDYSVASSATMIVAPDSTSTATLTVSSFGNFNSPVQLSGSWVGTAPTDVGFTITTPITPPPSGAATSTLTINAGAAASTGTYTLEVTASSGSLTHTMGIAVLVVPLETITTTSNAVGSDFSMSASSTIVSMNQGLSGSDSIIVNSVNGFSSPVTLSASWIGNAPSGVSYTLPSPITPTPGASGSSPVAITTTSTASTGSYSLRITGTSESQTHSVDIVVQVNQPGPQCIIATATYGSEVAPQVQLLRNFRDRAILRTESGSNFMIAFNAWYYSFSPTVANYISTHWVERTIMKGVLYPLIGILGLSYGTFGVVSGYPELAALVAGLLASSMIGAFYLGLPLSLLRARFRRLRGPSSRTLQLALGVALLSSLASLNIGEIFGSPLVLMVSSAAVVLSTLFLAAMITSDKLGTAIVSYRERGKLLTV